MALKGDFAKLGKLQLKVQALMNATMRERLSTVMGAEALTQVQLGFRSSRDPYGKPWPALAIRDGKPLLDTGRLRNSFTYRATSRGFSIGTNVLYAKTHQYGATIVPVRAKRLRFTAGRRGKVIFAKKVRIPRRQMVPEGRLGPIWAKALQAASKRFLAKLMRS